MGTYTCLLASTDAIQGTNCKGYPFIFHLFLSLSAIVRSYICVQHKYIIAFCFNNCLLNNNENLPPILLILQLFTMITVSDRKLIPMQKFIILRI